MPRAVIRAALRVSPQAWPMGRAGTAEEVANTVLWLLSEEASYVTGASLSVGGGRGATP